MVDVNRRRRTGKGPIRFNSRNDNPESNHQNRECGWFVGVQITDRRDRELGVMRSLTNRESCNPELGVDGLCS